MWFVRRAVRFRLGLPWEMVLHGQAGVSCVVHGLSALRRPATPPRRRTTAPRASLPPARVRAPPAAARLRFVNKQRKGPFSNADELMIGSFAPASAPHVFEVWGCSRRRRRDVNRREDL